MAIENKQLARKEEILFLEKFHCTPEEAKEEGIKASDKNGPVIQSLCKEMSKYAPSSRKYAIMKPALDAFTKGGNREDDRATEETMDPLHYVFVTKDDNQGRALPVFVSSILPSS